MEDGRNIEIGPIEISVCIEAKVRHSLSISYIQAAALFTRQVSRIERECQGSWPIVHAEHRGYVVGAVLLSVAFLEALINEFYTDVKDNVGDMNSLGNDNISLITSLWDANVSRASILDKYKIALSATRKSPFEKGERPYQDVQLLIDLRNALTHYCPEWIVSDSDGGQIKLHEFEKKLKGKFAVNPLVGAGKPFYPDKCLGHGCAEWALVSSLKFADEFFSKVGLQPKYIHVRSSLKTT